MMVDSKKNRGKVYTPSHIVNNILDLAGYCGETILRKNIIDNSCGDGAFLVEVIDRYIKESIKVKTPTDTIIKDLETYIHGIEINEDEHAKCINNVSKTAEVYGLKNIKWDIICGNSLNVTKYNNKMSFVVGNPPYVRVHNLGDNFENVKNFHFTQSGMTDLFIVFYEIGLNMLNKEGILAYITPSSLFNSLACKNLRKYFINEKLLTKVVDLKHNQVFDATTYTTIIVLSKDNTQKNVEYFEYDSEQRLKYTDKLEYNEFYLQNNFYFSKRSDLEYLKQILDYKSNTKLIEVKNGFATLADKFFIGSFDFKDNVIPIIKASTGEQKQCLYPYKNSCLIPYEKLTKNEKIKEYYEKNKTDLEKRSLEKGNAWYSFGRSQGIKDVDKPKYAISTIIKGIDSIKLTKCPCGVGVYSGLYILTDIPEEKIKEVILNQNFINYIKLLGKYKSGGYYTFSSGDLCQYLRYALKKETKKYEQLGIFGND